MLASSNTAEWCRLVHIGADYRLVQSRLQITAEQQIGAHCRRLKLVSRPVGRPSDGQSKKAAQRALPSQHLLLSLTNLSADC